MKKIMFNEEYGLQRAVLKGRKTMTRRMVPVGTLAKAKAKSQLYGKREEYYIRYYAYYKVGDIVAIAQRYSDLSDETIYESDDMLKVRQSALEKGWCNKMYVNAELMPHHIRITKVKVEHLQDISDDDCLKEGIGYVGGYSENYYLGHGVQLDNGEWMKLGNSPREAYSVLIDKISGKGTWERNPLVYVYEFELVD